jgi:hypothetical protein
VRLAGRSEERAFRACLPLTSTGATTGVAMDSQSYPASDKREQEQLEVIRALVEDATRDTTLWVQADPSAEERAHVFAIQTRLADLARIIERRMERRKLPKDEWE